MCFEKFPQTLSPNGNIALHLPPIPPSLPTVSILTPTGPGRHIFVELMVRNWEAIDYPPHLLEWVISDSGNTATLPNDPRIRRVPTPNLAIGRKRNFLASLARHDILVHMDDDDYYPPESTMARVRALLLPSVCCVGCDRVLCYDLLCDQTFEAYDPDKDGNPHTLSESTLAYRRDWWKIQGYNNNDCQAECLALISGRESQIRTLPYIFVVVQLTHSNNTITRRPHSDTHWTTQWPPRLPARDRFLLEDLRARVIQELPEWSDAIATVRKWVSGGGPPSDLSKVSPKILINPMVLTYLRDLPGTKQSGMSLAWYCGGGERLQFGRPWDGGCDQLGGSEEAVRDVAEGLVGYGWEVTVYVPIVRAKKLRGVRWKPLWEWRPNDQWEWLVIWRDPSVLSLATPHPKTKLILDLHDAIPTEWLRPYMGRFNSIITKSKFHAKICEIPNPVIIPNGINFDYKPRPKEPIILCTSSPDRCISSLVAALPLVRREIPNAEVWWAYGWREGIDEGGIERDARPWVRDWVKKHKELIANMEGFRDLGRISQREVWELYGRAKVFGYGTLFPEIDCISMTKAVACGCIPVVTHVGALGEKLDKLGMGTMRKMEALVDGTFDCGLPVGGEEFGHWVGELCEALRGEDGVARKMDGYEIGEVIERWLGVLGDKMRL